MMHTFCKHSTNGIALFYAAFCTNCWMDSSINNILTDWAMAILHDLKFLHHLIIINLNISVLKPQLGMCQPESQSCQRCGAAWSFAHWQQSVWWTVSCSSGLHSRAPLIWASNNSNVIYHFTLLTCNAQLQLQRFSPLFDPIDSAIRRTNAIAKTQL